jgi:hypothetical protein
LRRPVIFLGANLVLLLIVYFIAVDPVVTFMQERHHEIDRKAQAFVRMASLIERQQSISSGVDEPAGVSTQPFLQGETPSILNADLLAKLRQSAERHHVSFISVASQPHRKWLGHVLVGARVEFVASSRQTTELLTEIEASLPFLFVHSARLAASPKPDGGEEVVAVALEIYGATRWREN